MYCIDQEEAKIKGELLECEGPCVLWLDEELANSLDDMHHREHNGAGFAICGRFREGKPPKHIECLRCSAYNEKVNGCECSHRCQRRKKGPSLFVPVKEKQPQKKLVVA